MTDDITQAPFRLAFRHEGEYVNAYLASRETMEDSTLLATCRVTMLNGRVDFWDRWKAMVTEMFGAVVEDVTGSEPVRYDEERAPEHERSGHG